MANPATGDATPVRTMLVSLMIKRAENGWTVLACKSTAYPSTYVFPSEHKVVEFVRESLFKMVASSDAPHGYEL